MRGLDGQVVTCENVDQFNFEIFCHGFSWSPRSKREKFRKKILLQFSEFLHAKNIFGIVELVEDFA